jgi:hypothetical protein
MREINPLSGLTNGIVARNMLKNPFIVTIWQQRRFAIAMAVYPEA